MARKNWGKEDDALSSWSCTGCTNKCYRMCGDGQVYEYCRPVIEKGTNNRKWIGNHCSCLDYSTDPKKTDKAVRVHPDFLK